MNVAVDSLQPPTEPPVFMMIDAAEPRRASSSRPPPSTAVRGKTPDEGHRAKPPIELVLYVSSLSPHSTAALRNIRRALTKYSGSSVTLTVHDLSKDPERAERHGG